MANWQASITSTVTGMGYDLVELERSAGGLLRVTLDFPWSPDLEGRPTPITVEDCERVTRQLQYSLEVEGVDYQRLEVTSPGIDRLLRHAQDFQRFVGEVVDITLKAPIGEAAAGTGIAANRKKFRGELEVPDAAPDDQHWRITWSDAPAVKPGARVSKKRPPAPLQALDFHLDEVREARLAAIVNFKGKPAP